MSDLTFVDGDAPVIEMSQVAPSQVQWLVPGRVPRGAITVLFGPPGLGKTTIVGTRAGDEPRVIDPLIERVSTNAVGGDESEHVFASPWGEEMKR